MFLRVWAALTTFPGPYEYPGHVVAFCLSHLRTMLSHVEIILFMPAALHPSTTSQAHLLQISLLHCMLCLVMHIMFLDLFTTVRSSWTVGCSSLTCYPCCCAGGVPVAGGAVHGTLHWSGWFHSPFDVYLVSVGTRMKCEFFSFHIFSRLLVAGRHLAAMVA